MMPLTRRDGALHLEAVPLEAVAREHGTPCYVYSRAALESAWAEFSEGCAGRNALVCYAVKANPNLAILNLLARLGSGFDIVSGGELARVIAAGGAPARTVFSGVGKTESEMRSALEAGVLCFNVESEAELERLDEIASGTGRKAPVSLRVNPDVDPETHPYIATGPKETKFGVPFGDALRLYRKAARMGGVRVTGVGCHIGSQITDSGPFVSALERILSLADALAGEGIGLEHVDIGGGLGIRYRDERPPPVGEYLGRLFARIDGRGLKLLVEPGRSMVGNAGLLLTRVEYVKLAPARNFIVVDAAMNDLLRPALYEAWHDIVPVRQRPASPVIYDVVGPVCETGDFLGTARSLSVQGGDLLAVLSAGAYGMSMSSNYNTRPRAAEVIVEGSRSFLVRERERVESLFREERLLPG